MSGEKDNYFPETVINVVNKASFNDDYGSESLEDYIQRNENNNVNGDGDSSEQEGDILVQDLEDLRMSAALCWLDLTYSVVKGRRKRRKKRVILDHINGLARPGEMMAILGPSGAGKTTLLNLLAGRSEGGEASGEILLNGKKRDELFGSIAAYVEQDDIMISTLTVEETLRFAARLRLPKDMPTTRKYELVCQTLRALGLTKIKDQRVGSVTKRGISGGERKRTAIAIELLTNPSLLFLDEPTSGLDSFNACNLIKLLKQLAKSGRTIIMTIHQPRENIFDLYDKTLFLSQGRICYFGPPSDIIKHFGAMNYQFPTYTNPADYSMDIVTVDARSPELLQKSEARVKQFHDYYTVNMDDKVKEDSTHLAEQSRMAEEQEGTQEIEKYNAPYLSEVGIIANRNFLNWMRAKEVTLVELLQAVILGLLVGAVFFGAGNDQAGVQNRLGALFFILLNLIFSNVLPKLNTFTDEYALFRRERAANTYRVLPYYLGRTVVDMISIIAYPFILVIIAYFMVGLRRSASAFFTLLAILWAITLCARAFGLAISSITGSVLVAQVISLLFLLLFVLFGGFYANSATYWAGIAWIQYISFINYGFKAVVQNEFRGSTFTCPAGSSCTFNTGEDVIRFYNAGSPGIWICFIAILAFALFYSILAYAALKWRTRRKRMAL